MAVIATFGAVVAYRAVIAEEDTSSGERRLEQGQILELNRRADLLDTYRESAVFEDSENMARARGFYLQRQAENARKAALTGSITANELDLQAEEQFAIARMYRQIREYAYVGINDNDTIETGISRNVARELADAGYGAKWVEPAKGETPDIWGDLKADIATNRKKTVYLSGLVAVFVLALAFFTFTQLPKDGSALQRWLERVAICIAIIASIACFVIDPHSWLPFLLAGLGIGVVALLGHMLYERPGVQQWLNGPKEVVIPEKERAATEKVKAETAVPVVVPDPNPEPTQVSEAMRAEEGAGSTETQPDSEASIEVPGSREAAVQATPTLENLAMAKSAVGEEKASVAPGERTAESESAGDEKEEEPSHPHEVGPRIAFIGAHLLAWDCTSTMNRFALSLIAVTALLAAICGWRYDCATPLPMAVPRAPWTTKFRRLKISSAARPRFITSGASTRGCTKPAFVIKPRNSGRSWPTTT
jgi:hypothetical protein